MMSKFIFLFSLLLSVSIFGCKCESLNIEKSFKNADIVFIGNIYSVKQTPSGFKTLQNFISSVKIEKIFKSDNYTGFYQNEATLFSSQLRSCDYPFNKEGKYLIFGYIDSDTGFIYSERCFATADLSLFTSKDLTLLEKLHEKFEQELKAENNKPAKVESLIEDSPNRIINNLKLEINTLQFENKNLKSIIFATSILLILLSVVLIIKRRKNKNYH